MCLSKIFYFDAEEFGTGWKVIKWCYRQHAWANIGFGEIIVPNEWLEAEDYRIKVIPEKKWTRSANVGFHVLCDFEDANRLRNQMAACVRDIYYRVTSVEFRSPVAFGVGDGWLCGGKSPVIVAKYLRYGTLPDPPNTGRGGQCQTE